MPSVGTVCGAQVIVDDEAAIRCSGAECPAQLVQSIMHFASRKAMDIEGLGEANVELLISNKLIASSADLYYLDERDIVGLDRMGKKSADNLISAINKSKSND